REATPEQQKRYTELYHKFLISTYVPRFREYTNQKFTILKSQETDNREYLVDTEIISPGEPPIKVSYRVRQENGGYRIIDVIAEGVSLITTQRSEFNSILAREGLDSLLTR